MARRVLEQWGSDGVKAALADGAPGYPGVYWSKLWQMSLVLLTDFGGRFPELEGSYKDFDYSVRRCRLNTSG